MLFWLFVIIGIVGLILYKIGERYWDSFKHPILYNYDEVFETVGALMGIIALICVIVSLIVFPFNYFGIDAKVANWNEQHKALTYKMESRACRDELGLLSKEVIDEIQDWNTDVVYYQNIQDNFWLGIFYPNVYDQFETIDYTSYNRE